MTEMIERAARAIVGCMYGADPDKPLLSRGADPDVIHMGEPTWKAFVPMARAAIEAMREPTEAMIVVGAEQVVMITDRKRDFHPVKELWMDMIDAALK